LRQSDIQYFKEILESRREQISKNIGDTIDSIQQINGSDVSDEVDYANVNTDKMIDQAIASQQLQEIKEVDAALAKIENGTYGICEMCEEEIGTQRLKVKPHAKYCIICREIAEKGEK